MCDAVEISGPGFINLTLAADWLGSTVAAAAADPRLGVPPSRGAARRHRLLGPQRGQGDARRPPAHHRHRRRPRARARAPRPQRRPPEPHRRLGHALRHAHRAPPRRRRGVRGGAARRDRPQRLLPGGPREVRRRSGVRRARPGARGRAAGRRRGDAAPVARAGRALEALLQRHLRPARRAASPTPTSPASRPTTTTSPGCATSSPRPASRPSARGRSACSSTASPAARASRCRSSSASTTAATATARPTSRPCVAGCATSAATACSTSSARRSRSTCDGVGDRAPGRLAARRRAPVHVAIGNVLGADRKIFKTRSGAPLRLMALLDEAVARGSRRDRRGPPGTVGGGARRGRAAGRHRCGEVRRPLGGP